MKIVKTSKLALILSHALETQAFSKRFYLVYGLCEQLRDTQQVHFMTDQHTAVLQNDLP